MRLARPAGLRDGELNIETNQVVRHARSGVSVILASRWIVCIIHVMIHHDYLRVEQSDRDRRN